MIRVQIETTVVDTKSGIAAKTGKPYSIREQEGWAYLMGRDGKPLPHPQRVRFSLEDDQPPYDLGEYTLDPSSLYCDKFNQLSLRARLRRMAPQAVSKAA